MAIQPIQFSMRILLLLVAASALTVHFWPQPTIEKPDEKWSEAFSFFADRLPLTNIPTIAPVANGSGATEFRVIAKNTGNTVLEYSASGQERISLYQEIDVEGKWSMSNWEWCGTGKSRFEIAPKESVELVVKFWDDQKRERMLAMFTEKGTKRTGLVVLLKEPQE